MSKNDDISKKKNQLRQIQAALLDAKPMIGDPPPDHTLALLQADPWSGLTEVQKKIQGFKLRGLSQHLIASMLGISQDAVSKELVAIREVHKKRGASMDTNMFVGETISIYDELALQGWRGYFDIPDDHQIGIQLKLQFLQFIASITKDRTKFAMDIGIVQKAKTPIEVVVKTPEQIEHDNQLRAFEEKIKGIDLNKFTQSLLESGMDPLPDPEPADADIIGK